VCVDGNNTGSGNDIDTVLIAVVRTMRERNLSSRSLLHATREEYVTRHLLDGRIIYCDYRYDILQSSNILWHFQIVCLLQTWTQNSAGWGVKGEGYEE